MQRLSALAEDGQLSRKVVDFVTSAFSWLPYYQRKTLFRIAKRLLGKRSFPPRYEHIYEQIRQARPQRILEIGTNDGLNAVRMVKIAMQYSSAIEYYGFDLFEMQSDQDFLKEFSLRTPSRNDVLLHLKTKGVDSALLVAGDTTKTIPAMITHLPLMDLIFIDGGHSYETVHADWNNIQPIIHANTVVLFDDYPNFGVKPLIDHLDTSQWRVQVFPTTDHLRAGDFNSGNPPAVLRFQIVQVTRQNVDKARFEAGPRITNRA